MSLYCGTAHDSNIPTHRFAQLGLPVLPEAAGHQRFVLLNSWIQTCDHDHNCVVAEDLPAAYGMLPTRVIDVGDGEAKLMRLIEPDHGSRNKYLALSHRWGDLSEDQKFCTYNGNIETLKKEIPYDKLPKSFRDAVRVTRALHLRYLWIDSLCIIQDNKMDWDSESKKMEEVFSNAYCTVAASSAESSLAGFLGTRPPRDAVSVQTPTGTLYLAEWIDDFSSNVENSILSSRGWVLQERALSRRTIYFTDTQVYWECGRGVFCETLAWLRNPQSQVLGDNDFPSNGLRFYKDERIRMVQHIYQIYSALNLKERSDRSKAIFGLQKRIGRQFGSEAEYGVLWKWLERTILWRAETPGSLAKVDYKPENSVPSWSWMAYYGPVGFLDIPFSGVTWTGNVEPPTSPGPGDVHWDGHLQVKSSNLTIERSELLKRAILDRQSQEPHDSSWRCVVVGKGKAPMDGDGVAHYVLLIRPAPRIDEDGPFVRVGVANLLDEHFSSEIRSVSLM